MCRIFVDETQVYSVVSLEMYSFCFVENIVTRNAERCHSSAGVEIGQVMPIVNGTCVQYGRRKMEDGSHIHIIHGMFVPLAS